MRAFSSRAPEVLISGPAGTGKSRACLEKVHMMALINPGMRALIVRKTLTSLSSTALVTFREHVIREALVSGDVVWYGGSTQESAQYRYRNGSVVVLGGMDKATRVMSSEYDLVYVQEAIELTQNDWEALTTRLRNGKVSFQQIIADTNPDAETHWLKQRCNTGATELIESRHEDNPTLYDSPGVLSAAGKAYLDKLDNLTGVRRARLRGGLWVAAEGIIYDGYDPAIHLIDNFEIPNDWTRWWSIDFGFVHPFVCQRWAEDTDGRLYLYGETYLTKRLVEDHAAELRAVLAKEPRPRAIACDHDAEDRATLERHLGISTTPAKKTVSEGLQAVASRLKVQGDGKPRLFILRDTGLRRDPSLIEARKPTCTAEEIPAYVWESGDRERPLKVDDDGCDAMRYAVAQVDLRARPRVRFM